MSSRDQFKHAVAGLHRIIILLPISEGIIGALGELMTHLAHEDLQIT